MTDDLRALIEVVEAELAARKRYENTPTDRGGRVGPKGAARGEWHDARERMEATCAALRAKLEGE
jgi:hypothetical protein